ncbi:hypothetical protein [Streptomyces sp. NPDC056361]|uniref:hypothetical protein n=1 Tax=Streptomyces sp. NPDC056361 TaxID=3345795 RepID=UPI0035DB43A5
MTVEDIAYVELYTKDKVRALRHLVSVLGFTRVADCVEVDRSSVLLRQGAVQLVVTSGRGTWRFLSDHGEGVADIALNCRSVAAVQRAALVAGASVRRSAHGNPVVAGPAVFSHTLLPASPDGGLTLPAGRRWAATPGAPTHPTGPVHGIDHLAIRCPVDRLESYAAFCEGVLGLARSAPAERDATGSTVLTGGSGRASLVLGAADWSEPGVHRIAFRSAPSDLSTPLEGKENDDLWSYLFERHALV